MPNFVALTTQQTNTCYVSRNSTIYLILHRHRPIEYQCISFLCSLCSMITIKRVAEADHLLKCHIVTRLYHKSHVNINIFNRHDCHILILSSTSSYSQVIEVLKQARVVESTKTSDRVPASDGLPASSVADALSCTVWSPMVMSVHRSDFL